MFRLSSSSSVRSLQNRGEPPFFRQDHNGEGATGILLPSVQGRLYGERVTKGSSRLVPWCCNSSVFSETVWRVFRLPSFALGESSVCTFCPR